MFIRNWNKFSYIQKSKILDIFNLTNDKFIFLYYQIKIKNSIFIFCYLKKN